LIIDNYDSFTFNLYQLLAEVNGELPIVVRNDQQPWRELEQIRFDNIVISPGPGRPENTRDFGVSRDIFLNAKVPILGVCLGCQGLAWVFGGKIVSAPEPVHGRLSEICHDGSPLFEGVPQCFRAVRYHSLMIDELIPDCLETTAWTKDGLVMGIRHKAKPFWGVQFHPESVCTQYGKEVLGNFKKLTERYERNSAGHRAADERIWDLAHSVVPRGQSGGRNEIDLEVHFRSLDFQPDTERVFTALYGDAPIAFWLDSSLVEEGMSRFSYMGACDGPNSLFVRYSVASGKLTVTDREKTITRRASIFDYLKEELGRRRCTFSGVPVEFAGGFVGYLGYELKAECGSNGRYRSPLPDACFVFADRIIVFDHRERKVCLMCLAERGDARGAVDWLEETEGKLAALHTVEEIPYDSQEPPLSVRLQRPRATYLKDVVRCMREIRAGESYELCLTNQFHCDAAVDPLSYYRVLREQSPAPRSAFLRFGETAVACSSMELFVRVDRHRKVEAKPIKGTARRGESAAEDRVLREALSRSEKDRSENLMIVDLLRNDMGTVCEIGSVNVARLMDIETYPSVHQMVSTIRGRLRPELSPVDCVRALFPPGSMTGAPKLRSLEILDQLEKGPRGIYSGGIGFFGLNHTADFNVVIRTAVLTRDHVSIGTGGAVVCLSHPPDEYDEIVLKAKALIEALAKTTGRKVQMDDGLASDKLLPQEV
jgi:para-aminobenzoate synthetase